MIVEEHSGPNKATVDLIEGWTWPKVYLIEKNHGLHDPMVQLEVSSPAAARASRENIYIDIYIALSRLFAKLGIDSG